MIMQIWRVWERPEMLNCVKNTQKHVTAWLSDSYKHDSEWSGERYIDPNTLIINELQKNVGVRGVKKADFWGLEVRPYQIFFIKIWA